MPALETTYMGLALASPIIVGSSTLTIEPEKVLELEAAGAGAVVLKSIFEEQVRADVSDAYDSLDESTHPEARGYVRADLPMQLGPEQYLERIAKIKKAVKIPVIASINCVTPTQWVSFAEKIERAGADALELNVYDIPDDPDTSAAVIEKRHIDLLDGVKKVLSIPVAVKIGPQYSSLIDFARKLSRHGASAIVMFNRFFQPDIDIETLSLKASIGLSRPEDILLPLRWTAIVREQVSCDLSLSTGVHDAEAAVKAVLAGANTVQVCSAVYREGPGVVGKIIDGMHDWMERKGYKSLDDFRGLMREKDLADHRGFERAQYVKAFVGLE